jgi:hypothetical protein
MRNRLPTALLLLPLLLVLHPGAAEAQTITSPYAFIDQPREFGVFAGLIQENRGALELGPGDGIAMGARFAYNLSGPLGMEVSGFLFPTDRKIRVPGEEEGIDDLGMADAFVGAIEGRLRFTLTGDRTWHGLAPFLTAGGGVVGDFRGRDELEEEIPESVRFSFGPSFLGTLGAGTRWIPTESISIRAELSVHYWKLGTPEAFMQAGSEQIGQTVPDQEWAAVPALSLGLSLRR